MICPLCNRDLPVTAFPFMVKGKQSPDAPRQSVCRECRDKQHKKHQARQDYADRFDAGMIGRSNRRGHKYETKREPGERDRKEIALMNQLMATDWDGDDVLWWKMTQAVAPVPFR